MVITPLFSTADFTNLTDNHNPLMEFQMRFFVLALAFLICASSAEARYRHRTKCRSCQQTMTYNTNGGVYSASTSSVSTKSVSTGTSRCANGQCSMVKKTEKIQLLEVNIDK